MAAAVATPTSVAAKAGMATSPTGKTSATTAESAMKPARAMVPGKASAGEIMAGSSVAVESVTIPVKSVMIIAIAVDVNIRSPNVAIIARLVITIVAGTIIPVVIGRIILPSIAIVADPRAAR